MRNINIYSNTFEFEVVLKTATILYVESDVLPRDKISKYLKKIFGKVLIAKDGEEALDLFINNKVDILVTNMYLPIMSGIELLENIKSFFPNLPCIVTLKNHNPENIIDLIGLGINHIVVNPLDMNSLIIEVYKAYKVMYYYEQLQKKEEEVKKLNTLMENQILNQNSKLDFKDSKSRENILFKLKYLMDEESLFQE